MISIAALNQQMADYQGRIERINQEGWMWTATTPSSGRVPRTSIGDATLRQRAGRVLVVLGGRLRGPSTVRPLDAGAA